MESTVVKAFWFVCGGLIPYGITTSDGRSFREANGAVIDNDPETYEERCSAAVDMLRRAGSSQ